jgi:hypothetical protein
MPEELTLHLIAQRYPDLLARMVVAELHTAYEWIEQDGKGRRVPRRQFDIELWQMLLTSVKGDVAAAVAHVLATEDHSAEWLLTDRLGVRPTRAVVYELDQVYGGPEEGGWYFETGEIEDTIVIEPGDDLAAIKAHLAETYPEGKNRYSVSPRGRDYRVVYGFTDGQSWPQERPHYE